MYYDKFRIRTYRDDDGIIKEICVICGAKTKVHSDEHIDKRTLYIRGAGQLCDSCGKKLENEKN
jgi:hypothetical protein